MPMNALFAIAIAIHIIPEPVQTIQRAGEFTFNRSTKIEVVAGAAAAAAGAAASAAGKAAAGDRADAANAELVKIAGMFARRMDLRVTLQNDLADSHNAVILEIGSDPQIKNTEGYVLDISERRIKISANGPAGIFYGLESLQQLMPPGAPPALPTDPSASGPTSSIHPTPLTYPLKIPCVYILDYPRFPYRGMHLDVSRHFFAVSFIKQYLDILASFKINTFHWHLTDSHGWRLEIKQYPRLTSVGAWRADRKGIPMTIAAATGKNELADYGGYYTQAQVKEVIKYASDRFITVIPEIEMPGHCTAALVAYPQYSDLGNKNPLLIPCGYPGDLVHNFCVGYDSTFVFLENILKEVMELFPSQFIHIGGDEVKSEPWLNCPRCQQRMKDNGFTNTRQLQAWFTQRIDSFISANGKRMIGWDEVLEADLRPGAAIMSWHGNEGGIAGVRKGHDVVMAPYHFTYFDFYQSDPRLEPDITYAPLFLDTVYSFDPQPPGLTAGQNAHILGAEACLWTENISSPARVEYMLLPRLLALSECMWSPPEKKDYANFITKVEAQFRRFDAEKIAYATSLYNVNIQPAFDSARKNISVLLSDQAQKYQIRYTTEGSIPDARSGLYDGAILVRRDAVLKTALFHQGKRMGKINTDRFSLDLAAGAPISVQTVSASAQSAAAAAETQFACKRLVDGIFGTIEPYDGRWVGLHDSVTTLTIDLQKLQPIHSISLGCMEDQVSDIFLPRQVQFSASADGSHFEPVYSVYNKTLPTQLLRTTVTYSRNFETRQARFIRVLIRNANVFTQADRNGIFLDEITVR
jgi:hexosaminidase